MKQWTKNNMKILSKWRASTRSTAASSRSRSLRSDFDSDFERQPTSREMAAMQEAQSQADQAAEEANEPFSLGCCNSTNATGVSPTNDIKGSSNAQDGGVGYYPLDESSRKPGQSTATTATASTTTSNNEQQMQQQQPPIHQELFYFFLRRSWKKKLFTILVVLTISPAFIDLFILRTGYVTGFIDAFLYWMAEHPLLGVWAYVSMVVLTSLIFVPPSILIFAAGFTFQALWGSFDGIMIAMVASFLGSMMGGLIGFWRAKYMTRDLIEVLMRRYPIIKAVDAAIVKNSLRVMILMRLNSLIPFGVLNYVFGITGVDWAVFLLAMIGILPWHLLLICLGASAKTIYDEDAERTLMGIILIATGIACMIIGLAITWKFAKKELQKEVDAATPSTAMDYRIAKLNMSPWRSKSRKAELAPKISVEDSDLYATDYFLVQCLGEDSNLAVEYGSENALYQSNWKWNEIILDDFS